MIKKTSVSVSLSLLIVACQQHQVSNTSSTFAVTQSTPIMVTESQKEPSLGYMSSISTDGTSVVVKLPNGQERELSSTTPSYSATIGMISVQGKDNHLLINASTPTVSASGKVTGNGLFKPPSAPEGAHWQLIKLNGQDIDAKGSPRPPYLRMSANKMQGLTGCALYLNKLHIVFLITIIKATHHITTRKPLHFIGTHTQIRRAWTAFCVNIPTIKLN